MLQAGDLIDIWVVERALGSGGMGSVYRCHNKNAARILAAIKVLESGLRRYPEAEARFVREAEILFQLDHPNIVKVRNVRTECDPPYLEMEFVEGQSLEERLRQGAIPYGDAVSMMRQAASALQYLHERGIRHRDIKPANLLLQPDGRLKVVDFGLAVEADATRITQHGMAFGTVSYAPPEWITPDTLDPAKWDLYALGVLFWEILTGKVAFPVSGQGTARQQAMQVIVAKQNHPPLDPGPAYHDDVRSLIADMTRPVAADRVGDAAEVARRTELLEPTLRGAAGVTLMPTRFDEVTPAPQPSRTELPSSAWNPAPSVAAAETPKVPVVQSTRPPAARTGAGLALAAMGGAGVVAVGAAVTVAVAGGAWWFWPPAPLEPNALVVRLDGLPSGAAAQVAIDGVPVDSVDGRFERKGLPAGPVAVRWVAGADCTLDLCPGEQCPSRCAVGEREVTVDATGVVTTSVEVAMPMPIGLKLPLRGVPAGTPITAWIGDELGIRDGDVLEFTELWPGDHTLTIEAGDCPATDPCPAGVCPPGCTRAEFDIDFGFDGRSTPSEIELSLTAPAPVKVAPTPAQPRPPTPRAGGGTGLVSIDALGSWLATDAGRPFGPGQPLSNHLKGWPSEGVPKGWFTIRVSGQLAETYCSGRGGVLAATASPPPTEGAEFEWRSDGATVVLWEAAPTGPRVTGTRRTDAVPGARFRCSR